jgi:hypothetical protein
MIFFMGSTVNKKREIIIKIKMIELGVSGAAIARTLGVDRVAVNSEIRGQRGSRRVRHGICDALGLKYEHLWGPDVLFKKKSRKAQAEANVAAAEEG